MLNEPAHGSAVLVSFPLRVLVTSIDVAFNKVEDISSEDEGEAAVVVDVLVVATIVEEVRSEALVVGSVAAVVVVDRIVVVGGVVVVVVEGGTVVDTLLLLVYNKFKLRIDSTTTKQNTSSLTCATTPAVVITI